MIAAKLIAEIKRQGSYATDAEVASLLGVTRASISQWQSGKGEVTERKIANAIVSAKKASKQEAHRTAFKPIVEFFPIEDHWDKNKSVKAQVFDSTTAYKGALKNALQEATSGIYIFYNSIGKALYVGKTQKSIWREMNLAYNRPRDAQEFLLVTHPSINVLFKKANEKNRQPKLKKLKLYELASFFSAYEVDSALVSNLEALLIRAFPNDLLNTKMEKIKS